MKAYSVNTLLGLGLAGWLAACSPSYEKKIEADRQSRNEFMRGEESPLPSLEMQLFEGLDFYPINETYRVIANVERLPVGQYYRLPLTDGGSDQYVKFGFAVFELLGSEHQLLLLRNPRERSQLFLAFTDLTNGDGSYGGGRYLDLEYNNSGKLVIDFNQAYNPFCAYSGQYVCPVPPQENHLEIPVPAGEKTYQSHSEE